MVQHSNGIQKVCTMDWSHTLCMSDNQIWEANNRKRLKKDLDDYGPPYVRAREHLPLKKAKNGMPCFIRTR